MKIYLYDGSFEGLLTAIFYAYQEKSPIDFAATTTYTHNLLDDYIIISTEECKFNRVYNSVYEKLSPNTLKNVYYLYLSEIEGCEKLINDYLHLCFKHSDSINLAKNNETIALVDKYTRRVSLEAHRFQGFIRFKEISPALFYSTISPDHNILPLIMHSFAKRFSDQNFIIHDLKRSWAIVYNLKEVYLKDIPLDFYKKFSINFKDIHDSEQLFKVYYESVTIEERCNPRLQKNYMPTRYWKHIFEVN